MNIMTTLNPIFDKLENAFCDIPVRNVLATEHKGEVQELFCIADACDLKELQEAFRKVSQ